MKENCQLENNQLEKNQLKNNQVSESQLERNQIENNFSIFHSLLWMIFLALGIQTILSFFWAMGFEIAGVPNNELEHAFLRPYVIALTGVISAILSIPLIKTAAHQTNKIFLVQFLALRAIDKTTLIKILLLGVGYCFFESIITDALSIDTPQFMLDVKAQTTTSFDILMLVLGICIVAPIVEEVIFRGLAYARLVQSRAGVSGAIIITSLVFTMIHFQYDFDILGVLLVFAFILGYVRYKTGNLVYCIILHMQLNIFSTVELFLFT